MALVPVRLTTQARESQLSTDDPEGDAPCIVKRALKANKSFFACRKNELRNKSLLYLQHETLNTCYEALTIYMDGQLEHRAIFSMRNTQQLIIFNLRNVSPNILNQHMKNVSQALKRYTTSTQSCVQDCVFSKNKTKHT